MSLTLLLGLVLIVIAGAALARGRGGERRGASDLEAKLRPVEVEGPAAGARGKAEREHRPGASAEFEARVTGLDLPDGTDVEFVVADVVLGSARLIGGRTRLEFDSRLGQSVPPIVAGLLLEVRHEGTTLLSGEFYRD